MPSSTACRKIGCGRLVVERPLVEAARGVAEAHAAERDPADLQARAAQSGVVHGPDATSPHHAPGGVQSGLPDRRPPAYRRHVRGSGRGSGGRMRDYHVAWWNLENLFDEENASRWAGAPTRCSGRSRTTSPAGRRSCATARSHQLASVIAQMNDGAGPGPARRVRGREPVRARPARRRGERGPARAAQLRGRARRHRRRPRHRRRVHLRRHPVRGSRAARGVGVLPRRDAPQRHPRDRPGQLPDHHGRPDLGGVRQPLALPQRRPVRVGRLPRHRRRDPRLLPRAGARGARTQTPRCWRWATSTTNRSTPPWSSTR